MVNKNLNLYNIFVEVAKSKSYADAANKLGISTVSVCKDIQTLEKNLDRQLFYKNFRGVKLTSDGERLFESVEKGLLLINEGEKLVVSKNDLETGELSIGCPTHIFQFYLMDKIEKAENDYPNLKLKLENSENGKYLLQELKEHKIDFMIDSTKLDITDNDVVVEKLEETHNVFISNKPIKISNLKEIEKLPLILTDKYTHTTQNLVECMKKKSVTLNPKIYLNVTELRVEMAKRGIGVSYVMEELVKKEIENEEVYVVDMPVKLPETSINLIYLKGQLTTADKKFINKYIRN